MKDKNNAIRWGLTVFVTVAAILLFYDTLFGRRVLLNITRQFLRALQPVIIGGLLAYLLAPAIDFIEDALFSGRLQKAREGGKLISRGARAVSLVLVWVMIGLLLYLLGHVLLPQLYQSVVQLVSSVETYYNTVSGWVERLLESNPEVEAWVAAQMDTFYETATAWLKSEVISRTQALMIAVSGGVLSTVNFLKNLLVGAITTFMLYLLFGLRGKLVDNRLMSLTKINLPLIRDIPFIGRVLENLTIIDYLSYIIAVILFVYLYKTVAGFRTLSVGINKAAAESLGATATRIRMEMVILSGALCGLGGVVLSMGQVTMFTETET